ncbi:hypothetical protein D918_04085 [Trichuris suis]|nr:hypothetical protein D918_04085 [Trichuris suis]
MSYQNVKLLHTFTNTTALKVGDHRRNFNYSMLIARRKYKYTTSPDPDAPSLSRSSQQQRLGKVGLILAVTRLAVGRCMKL